MATNIQITEPPSFLRDYYAALAERGMNLGNLGFTPYTQPRVAPWQQQQEAAAQMIQQRALQGSPAMQQAGNYFQNTLSGNIRNPYAGMENPYLNQAINRAMGDVSSRINSRFNDTAFGGTAHQQTLAREMGNVANQMRMQDYGTQQQLAESQLGRQQQMMSFAPTLAANDYADAQAMMGLGNQLQGYNQQIADANYQEFLRQQQYPGQQLQYMAAGLSPSAAAFSNRSTTTPDQQPNTFANMMAGGMGGYSLANSQFGRDLGFTNPWMGALAGGILGGMM